MTGCGFGWTGMGSLLGSLTLDKLHRKKVEEEEEEEEVAAEA